MSVDTVTAPAWCGRCGESFPLDEVVEVEPAGACPRCGRLFAPGYTTVLAGAVRQLLDAVDAVDAAGTRLRDVAPTLHVDTRALCAALHEALDRGAGGS